MGIYWTEFGTDGEDDVQGAWHCPVGGDGEKLNLVKGGIELEDTKTGEKEFIDLAPEYPLDSIIAYCKFSSKFEKHAPGWVLNYYDLIDDYIIGDIKRFEERLDEMEFKHFDGVSALKEEVKKRYEPYFNCSLVKVNYSIGLENYLKEFHAETKIHVLDSCRTWILINHEVSVEEAIDFASKNGIFIPKGKMIKSDKNGVYATTPLEINGKTISVKLERFSSSSFLNDCGLKNYRFHGVKTVSHDFTYFPFHKYGKLFRLDHYYDLFKGIMEKLMDRYSVTLNDNDSLRGMQEFNWEHEPDLRYIKETDTQKIIDTFKGMDELCEKWKIDRIPVIPLVKSIKRKIAEGKIKV